ncbi:hypothetical protein Ae201684P_004609 [Aphanomyces euteiches]|uniref:Crinkler (CRN) family protein n=1 Tax=Aphanomyces euteiches TaxID=100861 RepID=A0A6G0XCN7_9STRA|nr:hypothetical protein Ae201684_006288 [Aphanomyces euteiches]KAH9068911.1 hypothetical protein Ae201684P_004609 [Aphanomyces euteiches]
MVFEKLICIICWRSVREVWYVLVYSQANLSSADTVLIPPNSHVVRFRDAVHAKNTAILPGIVPLQLEVVTNKAAFGGKDDPLDPGAEIGEQLGKLEDKLFVVVPAEAYPTKRMKTMSPQPRQEWFTSELTVFCSIELSSDEWLAMKYGGMFQNLSLNDKGMEDNEPSNESMTSGSDMRDFQTFDMHFPVLMGHSGEASVFVRPCYEELFKLLLKDIDERNRSVGITGNPGIGKSLFYAYCVFRLTQEPIDGRTLIVNCDGKYAVYGPDGFRYITTIEELLMYQDNENVIRLIDGRSTHLFTWVGVSILFTSPGYAHYKTFLKPTCVEYVMPPWTEQELCIAAQFAGITNEEINNRFQVFGGIARYAFSKEVDGHFKCATQAYSNVNALQIINVVRGREEVNEKMYPHRLLHMFPQHSESRACRGFYVTFGSNYNAEKVYDKLMNDSMDQLTAFMVANAEDTNSSSFCGKLFEIFCHRLWLSSNQHRLVGKLLHNNSQASQEAEYSI